MPPTGGNNDHELAEVAWALERADASFAAGKYQESANVYRQCLDFLERTLGEEDPETVTCLEKLADALYKGGDYATAEPVYSRLLSIGSRLLGSTDPHVRDLAARLASCQSDETDDSGAISRQSSFTTHTTAGYQNTHSRAEEITKTTEKFAVPEKDGRKSEDSTKTSAENNFGSEAVRNQKAQARPSKEEQILKSGGFAKSRGSSTNPVSVDAAHRLSISRENMAGVGFVFLLLILIGLVAVGIFSLRDLARSSSKGPPQNLKNLVYATADNGRSITLVTVGEAVMKFAGHEEVLDVPLKWIGPDWRDFLSPAFEVISHKNLYFQRQQGSLTDEAGTVYFSKDAPERKVVDQIRHIVSSAQNYYTASGSYPQDAAWCSSQAWKDPVTGDLVTPSITQITLPDEDGRAALQTSTNEKRLSLALQSSASSVWTGEPPPRPCAIDCLSLNCSTAKGPSNEFYVHGYDRHGRLISNDLPLSVFVAGVGNGQNLIEPVKSSLPKSQRLIQLIIATLPEGAALKLMICLAPIIFIVSAIFAVIGTSMFKSKGQYSHTHSPVELIASVVVVLSAVWAVALLFAA